MSARSDATRMAGGSAAPSPWVRWAGYAACVWALAFAAVSFYWAAGGTAGGSTIGPALTSLAVARDPTFIAILWVTGALKVVAALLALALVRPWGRRIPRWAPLVAGWSAGAGLILYGAASFVQHALMVTGIIGIAAGLGATAARWHLLLWDPWWLLGGILFAVAAWRFGRETLPRGQS